MIGLLTCLIISLPVSASPEGRCYVIGDTSGNQISKKPGSKHNPYGSLAEVEADEDCNNITVLYSDVALDGGIILKDRQKLDGEEGPDGVLPVITNTTGNAGGVGILMAQDNQVKSLHVKDTLSSGILGAALFQPFGGNVSLKQLRVTGANQLGAMVPDNTMALGSIMLVASRDMKAKLDDIYAGEANVPSVVALQLAGHMDIKINQVTVNHQNQLTQSFEFSPGIYVAPFNDASVDVDVKNTTVSDIGSNFASNSDGLLLVNFGSGHMTARVDQYEYSNPDGGGWFGSSSGIEVGMVHTPGGGTFEGKITNSRIDGAFATGIQVIDQDSIAGGNTTTVEVSNNEISDVLFGIEAFVNTSPNSSMYVDISDNVVSATPRFGFSEGIFVSACCEPVDNFEAHIEGNTVLDIVGAALTFASGDNPVNNLKLDAGLGSLGSAGQNRIIGTTGADVRVIGVHAVAAGNWWGSDLGPAAIVEENGGTVDVDPFLTNDPDQ